MSLPRLAGLATAATAACLLTACSSSSVGNDSHTTADRPPSTPAKAATVGSIIRLHGSDAGQQLTVRLDRILARAKGTSGNRPAHGRRYFAAELTITNTGTARLKEGPWISTTVSDAAGHQYDTADVTGITAGAELPGEVKTPHGAARTGWIVFEVPTTAKITGLEYGATGGLGDTAGWAF